MTSYGDLVADVLGLHTRPTSMNALVIICFASSCLLLFAVMCQIRGRRVSVFGGLRKEEVEAEKAISQAQGAIAAAAAAADGSSCSSRASPALINPAFRKTDSEQALSIVEPAATSTKSNRSSSSKRSRAAAYARRISSINAGANGKRTPRRRGLLQVGPPSRSTSDAGAAASSAYAGNSAPVLSPSGGVGEGDTAPAVPTRPTSLNYSPATSMASQATSLAQNIAFGGGGGAVAAAQASTSSATPAAKIAVAATTTSDATAGTRNSTTAAASLAKGWASPHSPVRFSQSRGGWWSSGGGAFAGATTAAGSALLANTDTGNASDYEASINVTTNNGNSAGNNNGFVTPTPSPPRPASASALVGLRRNLAPSVAQQALLARVFPTRGGGPQSLASSAGASTLMARSAAAAGAVAGMNFGSIGGGGGGSGVVGMSSEGKTAVGGAGSIEPTVGGGLGLSGGSNRTTRRSKSTGPGHFFNDAVEGAAAAAVGGGRGDGGSRNGHTDTISISSMDGPVGHPPLVSTPMTTMAAAGSQMTAAAAAAVAVAVAAAARDSSEAPDWIRNALRPHTLRHGALQRGSPGADGRNNSYHSNGYNYDPSAGEAITRRGSKTHRRTGTPNSHRRKYETNDPAARRGKFHRGLSTPMTHRRKPDTSDAATKRGKFHRGLSTPIAHRRNRGAPPGSFKTSSTSPRKGGDDMDLNDDDEDFEDVFASVSPRHRRERGVGTRAYVGAAVEDHRSGPFKESPGGRPAKTPPRGGRVDFEAE